MIWEIILVTSIGLLFIVAIILIRDKPVVKGHKKEYYEEE